MKDKLLQIRVDEDFLSKLKYLQRINGWRTIAETVRQIVEKEWRKEREKELPPSPSRPQEPQISFGTLQRACKHRCLSMDRYGGDDELHPTCHHTIYASWGECNETACPLLKPYKG